MHAAGVSSRVVSKFTDIGSSGVVRSPTVKDKNVNSLTGVA